MKIDLSQIVEDLDNTPLTFGRYKGQTPDYVSDYDPDYIVWMYKTLDTKWCSKAMYKYCLNLVEDEE